MTAHSTLSMLDLVAVREGGSVRDALAIALATARHAEALGFTRYWLAEHHNMEGIASSATAVLVGHIAAGTQTLRVGSGGVMLPNHAPLVVAEAFGTLAELFPGRIDLGLGRAPGTDPLTMRALRRDRQETEQDFPRDVAELIAAPTDDEAQFLASSTFQRVLGILKGERRKLAAPVHGLAEQLLPQERAAIDDFLAAAVIGGHETVRQGFAALLQATQADELMLVCDIYDPALRLRSLDIAAAAHAQLQVKGTQTLS